MQATHSLCPLRVPPSGKGPRPLLQGEAPAARGLPFPGGDRLRQVSLGEPGHRGKATMGSDNVATAHLHEDAAGAQPWTGPSGGGRERRHRIPRKAAGPTSGSLPLPPSAPPPLPAQSRPEGRGPACWEAAWTRLDSATRVSGRAGRRSPARLECPART